MAKKLQPNKMSTANFFSRLFFWWMNDFFELGSSRTLNETDMFELQRQDKSEVVCNRLEANWNKELSNRKLRKPSLFRAIVKTYGPDIALMGILAFSEQVVRTLMPVLIAALVRYFEDQDSTPVWHAYGYATAICFSSLFLAINLHHLFFYLQRIGWHLRASACALMYKKTLRLSQKALNQTTTGQIVTLSATDVIRYDYFAIFVHYLWIAPIQSVAIAIIMWQEVGVAVLAGMGMMFATMIMQSLMGKAFGKLRTMTAVLTDNRIRLMNEVISGIRIIKMYVWEKPFSKLVSDARRKEVKKILMTSAFKAFNDTLFFTQDKTFTFITLLVYVLLEGEAKASTVFFVVGFGNVLRVTVGGFFPFSVEQLSQALATTKRIEAYLVLDEMVAKQSNPDKKSQDGTAFVELKNFTGKWDTIQDAETQDRKEDTLQNISVRVNAGELLAVIGPVGSGKSSFLSAILGELPLKSGSVEVNGNIVYASQIPWVFSGTIRENILFGEPYDQERYTKVISACCLTSDLKLFPDGDMTLVGERGVILSGGQKARVNLARAAYKKGGNICVLDDPLSAVDVPVASHIYQHCISGIMRDRVRVLVTHQLQLLKTADKIMILKEGKIDRCGTYEQLQASETDFASLLSKKEDDDTDEQNESSDIFSQTSRKKSLRRTSLVPVSQNLRKMSLRRTSLRTSMRSIHSAVSYDDVSDTMEDFPDIEPEEIREQGSIGGKVYLEYFRVGAHAIYLLVLTMVIVSSHVLLVMNDWWLSQWTLQYENYIRGASYRANVSSVGSGDSDSFTTSPSDDETEYDDRYYLVIYSVLCAAMVFTILLRANMHFYLCVTSGIHMHHKMFQAILRAPVRFFDTNPIGRVLNRFSKDLGQVDELLPKMFMDFLFISGFVLSLVILTAIINYFVLIVIIPLVIYFIWLRQYFLRTSRDIKRLEGSCRSPVFSLLSSTLQGLVTVRAFGAESKFMERFHDSQDLHSASWFLFLTGSRWFALRLDALSATFISSVAFGCVIVTSLLNINSGDIGLILTYSASCMLFFQWGVRQSAEVENLMTSVERIQQYYRLPPEAADEIPEMKPHKDWPTKGFIKFEHVSFAYYKDGPIILKDINLEIRSQEKIGLVGRTGAGKSSLISALFRLAELADGKIYIDGIDISSIGLNDLRSVLSIIPQDPILFSGTMRRNLDPFNEYKDEDLWNALEEVQLHDFVKELPSQLNTELAESGSNFSVGQRQLVCLARAILKKSKILLVDEATANVDIQTDRLIQVTIREKFKQCTVITIAHRINTIIDSDRVVVLDAGRVKEFDEPYILLKNRAGLFSRMIASTGASSAALRQGAKKAYILKHKDDNTNVRK